MATATREDQIKQQIEHLRTLRDNADAARIEAANVIVEIKSLTERMRSINQRVGQLPSQIAEELVDRVRKEVEAGHPEINQKLEELQTLIEARRASLDDAIRKAISNEQGEIDVDAKVTEILGGESLPDILKGLDEKLEIAQQMVRVDEAAVATYDFRIAELEEELKGKGSVIGKVTGRKK